MDFTKLKDVDIAEAFTSKNIEELDYATFEMDGQGANLSIFFKDKKSNALSILSKSVAERLYFNDDLSKDLVEI